MLTNNLLQKGRYQEAANAAFTFLSHYPNHEMVTRSLRHYLTLPGMTQEKIMNAEAAPFIQMYIRGVQAYENENYAEAVGEFEYSLKTYMDSEESCRIYCEGPFDQGWYPEFTSSVTSKRYKLIQSKNICKYNT